VKETEKAEMYPFVKFNKKAEVIRYTEDEYNKFVKNLKSDWTKEETDHLLDLCEQFSLKFIVIADRYDSQAVAEEIIKPSHKKRDKKANEKLHQKMNRLKKRQERTVDEIKERYYEVAKAVLEGRNLLEHPLMKKPFNYEQEVRRKNNLEKLFFRTKDQQDKEKQLLQEMKKLEQKIKKEEKEEKNLRRLIYADTNFTQPPQMVTTIQREQNGEAELREENEVSQIILDDGPQKGGRRDRGSGVYLRSQMLLA